MGCGVRAGFLWSSSFLSFVRGIALDSIHRGLFSLLGSMDSQVYTIPSYILYQQHISWNFWSHLSMYRSVLICLLLSYLVLLFVCSSACFLIISLLCSGMFLSTIPFCSSARMFLFCFS